MEQPTNSAKTIIGIGSSGLVGSRISETLTSYTIRDFSTENGIDITDESTLAELAGEAADTVLLLAAKADVDCCEQDKPLADHGLAWKINVDGVANVVTLCKNTGKKLIFISTDFVFDGENVPAGGYSEEDQPHPTNWYGITKRKGEEIVLSSGIPFLILRIAYPYRSKFSNKNDFVQAMKNRLESGKELFGVTDHIMTPTYVDDITLSLEVLLEGKKEGIFHVVGSEHISPYDAALTIADVFHLDQSLIKKTTREVFFKGRALRPFNLAMKNDKIKSLGVSPRTFREGLEILSKNI